VAKGCVSLGLAVDAAQPAEPSAEGVAGAVAAAAGGAVAAAAGVGLSTQILRRPVAAAQPAEPSADGVAEDVAATPGAELSVPAAPEAAVAATPAAAAVVAANPGAGLSAPAAPRWFVARVIAQGEYDAAQVAAEFGMKYQVRGGSFGQGVFSRVSVGTRLRGKADVAIKKIKRKEDFQLSLKELSLLEQLQHPNIVELLDAWLLDERVVMVLSFHERSSRNSGLSGSTSKFTKALSHFSLAETHCQELRAVLE